MKSAQPKKYSISSAFGYVGITSTFIDGTLFTKWKIIHACTENDKRNANANEVFARAEKSRASSTIAFRIQLVNDVIHSHLSKRKMPNIDLNHILHNFRAALKTMLSISASNSQTLTGEYYVM